MYKSDLISIDPRLDLFEEISHLKMLIYKILQIILETV